MNSTKKAAGSKKRKLGKKKIILICVAAVLVAGAAFWAVYHFALSDYFARRSAVIEYTANENPEGSPVVDKYAKSGSFTYAVYEDGTATLTSCRGSEKNITVPETVGGHTVLTIGYSCFFNDPDVISISIPDSVKYYEPYAFYGMSGLREITVPESMKEIGEGTFVKCSSLEEITIPAGVSAVGEGAFSECTSLKSVTFQGSDIMREIGGYAFSYCEALKDITLPGSITAIGAHAFDGCAALSEIRLPSHLNELGEYAFKESGVTDITADPSAEGPVRLYNLQGIEMGSHPAPGIYLRRQGNNTTKVIVN